MNEKLLSNNIAVIELNLADVRRNTKDFYNMDLEIFNNNLKGIERFRDLFKKNPKGLSDDPQIQEALGCVNKI